jgi:hypothetical protein
MQLPGGIIGRPLERKQPHARVWSLTRSGRSCTPCLAPALARKPFRLFADARTLLGYSSMVKEGLQLVSMIVLGTRQGSAAQSPSSPC